MIDRFRKASVPFPFFLCYSFGRPYSTPLLKKKVTDLLYALVSWSNHIFSKVCDTCEAMSFSSSVTLSASSASSIVSTSTSTVAAAASSTIADELLSSRTSYFSSVLTSIIACLTSMLGFMYLAVLSWAWRYSTTNPRALNKTSGVLIQRHAPSPLLFLF